MDELTKCDSGLCPWKKECLRSTTQSNIKKGETFLLAPYTKEGCPYFITEDLLKKRINLRMSKKSSPNDKVAEWVGAPVPRLG